MKPWKNLTEPEIIKVGWRTLTRKTFERPDGVEAEYVTVGEPGARHGAVIALTQDNKVVIAEQFRPGPEEIMLELPGGNIESGEDPQQAVLRELKEEVGYATEEVEFLGTIRKDAYANATWYFYIARNAKQIHDQDLDEGEFVNIKLVSIAELITAAKTGKMSDAQAILMAYDQLMEIQNKETL